MQNAAKTYFQTQVTTTTPGDILIMLYDGAIKFLKQSKERMAAKDYAKKGILISKALDILAELQGCLNAQKGGELAENLCRLYLYCSSRLLTANLKMDPTIVDEVIRILSGLREAYSQINAQLGGKVPAPGAEAVPAKPSPPSVVPPKAGPARVESKPAPAAESKPAPAAESEPAPVAAKPVVTIPVAAPEKPAEAPTPEVVAMPPVSPYRRAAAAYAANRVKA